MAEKQKYLVVMHLRWKGKRYNNGDFIKLTPEEAAAVPSHRIERVASIAESIDAEFKASIGSADNDARDAVKFIEDADDEDLEGFLDKREDRITVLRAWDQRFGTHYAEGEEH